MVYKFIHYSTCYDVYPAKKKPAVENVYMQHIFPFVFILTSTYSLMIKIITNEWCKQLDDTNSNRHSSADSCHTLDSSHVNGT